MRRLTLTICAVAFVATVWFANWLVNRYGVIRVWPTDLYAPCAVYVVGVAFLLRDTVQRFGGQLLALGLIAAGAGLSWFVSPTLAVASAAAFAASEVVGLAIFAGLGGNTGGPPQLGAAVVCATVVAAAIDSLVFLWLAFHSLAFFEGQWVGKVMVVALAVPFVLGARRRWPQPVRSAA